MNPNRRFRLQTCAATLAIALWLCGGPLHAQTQGIASPPVYKMWEERQELGSLVRRRGVTSPLALNHTYEQLSGADRAQLHAFFKKLGPGDEPPFPLYGIGPILRAMINEGTFGKIESGNVLVVVEVDAEGNGVSAKVSGASTPQVAREFAAKVALERFKPALCAGKPCPGAFPMVFAVGEP